MHVRSALIMHLEEHQLDALLFLGNEGGAEITPQEPAILR